MGNSPGSTVRKEIFITSLFFLSVTLAAFCVFFSRTLYQSEMSKAKNMIRQRNYAINFFIDGYFSEIKNTISVLASDENIQHAPRLDAAGQQKILDTYRTYQTYNKNITYIYSAYSNGLLLINDYTPPEVYNPVTRPWYTSAMAARPEISVGTPYQDINDKEWLISTGKAVASDGSEYQGVVAIDSSIQMLADLLATRGLDYKSSYSYILNADKRAIIHHEEKYINRLYSEVVNTSVKLDQDRGEFTYLLGEIEKKAYYSRIPETGWIIVTVVETREIVHPIVWKIILTAILPILLALLFAIGQSRLLNNRFSKPLYKLKKDIMSIVSGKSPDQTGFRYPDNEIGFIAKEVEQLAEKELYKRAQKLEAANTTLNKTIEELNTLRGIIPICSSCKKIRDDEGSWNQLESYIEKHSDAAFSHGLCPDCLEALYGSQDWYKKKKK